MPQINYIIDTNIFIEASRRYYPLDFAKPFWEGLIKFAHEGVLCSIDKVLNEIKKGNDLLKVWAEKEFIEYFNSTEDEKILNSYSSIVQWAQKQNQYSQSAKDIFMEEDNADVWVIAFALTNNYIIVTHEVFSPDIS